MPLYRLSRWKWIGIGEAIVRGWMENNRTVVEVWSVSPKWVWNNNWVLKLVAQVELRTIDWW